MADFLKGNLIWTRKPQQVTVEDGKVEIVTEAGTDLWQRTFYDGYQNDTAPVLQVKTNEQSFSFVVKTKFDFKNSFDQCGIVIYLDSDNWMKASIEYENEKQQLLGSVVTNHGYSDWAVSPISTSITEMWYRLSRRGSDYRIEYSTDGVDYQEMRLFHLFEGAAQIAFGIYACSPEDSSFTATFTDMEVTNGIG